MRGVREVGAVLFESMTVGERIKRLRKGKNLTLAEAARIIDVPAAEYLQFERGNEKLSAECAKRLAHEFGVETDFILRGKCKSPGKISIARRHECATLPGIDPMVDYCLLNDVKPVLRTIKSEPESKRIDVGRGYVYNYVLEGCAQLGFAGDIYELGPGDSVYFEANCPHYIASRGKDLTFLTLNIL